MQQFTPFKAIVSARNHSSGLHFQGSLLPNGLKYYFMNGGQRNGGSNPKTILLQTTGGEALVNILGYHSAL